MRQVCHVIPMNKEISYSEEYIPYGHILLVMNRVLVVESIIMVSVRAGTSLTRKTNQTTTQKVRTFIHTPHVMYTWLEDGLADPV